MQCIFQRQIDQINTLFFIVNYQDLLYSVQYKIRNMESRGKLELHDKQENFRAKKCVNKTYICKTKIAYNT